MIIQLYDRNKSFRKFKQHWYPWSTFQDASFSPQESPNFKDSKNSKIWQICHRYFRFDLKVFWSRWKLLEIIFEYVGYMSDGLNVGWWYVFLIMSLPPPLLQDSEDTCVNFIFSLIIMSVIPLNIQNIIHINILAVTSRRNKKKQ